MDTIIELLKKIKKLADKGIDGEWEVAQNKLKLLLKKHNLTLDDIADQSISWHEFKYKTEMEKQLLFQCAAYIMQTHNILHVPFGNKKIGFEITKTQAVDMKAIYNHYRKELKDELEVFFSAFLHRHSLFGPTQGKTECEKTSIEELERLKTMMFGLNSKHWLDRKQIN